MFAIELPRLSCLIKRGPLARPLNRQLEEVAMPVMTIPVCKCEVRGINLLKRSCLPFAAQQTLYSFH